jgi:hypothetical protein
VESRRNELGDDAAETLALATPASLELAENGWIEVDRRSHDA